MAKVIAYISAVIIVSPTLAPLVGSLLLSQFNNNWHSIFICLGVFGFISLLLVVFCLQESNKHKHTNPLNLAVIFKDYFSIFK